MKALWFVQWIQPVAFTNLSESEIFGLFQMAACMFTLLRCFGSQRKIDTATAAARWLPLGNRRCFDMAFKSYTEFEEFVKKYVDEPKEAANAIPVK